MEGSQGDHPHQPPSSPSMGRPQIKHCIEELLKFTLTSSIDETLSLDIGLSKEYCSKLLKDDPAISSDNTSATSDVAHGVPTYPLYKFLASAIYQTTTIGAFSGSYEKVSFISQGKSSKQQEDAWIQLIMGKGCEILNVLENVEFELHVQEPYFSQLKDGLKTVEGRCAVGNYNRHCKGITMFQMKLKSPVPKI